MVDRAPAGLSIGPESAWNTGMSQAVRGRQCAGGGGSETSRCGGFSRTLVAERAGKRRGILLELGAPDAVGRRIVGLQSRTRGLHRAGPRHRSTWTPLQLRQSAPRHFVSRDGTAGARRLLADAPTNNGRAAIFGAAPGGVGSSTRTGARPAPGYDQNRLGRGLINRQAGLGPGAAVDKTLVGNATSGFPTEPSVASSMRLAIEHCCYRGETTAISRTRRGASSTKSPLFGTGPGHKNLGPGTGHDYGAT